MHAHRAVSGETDWSGVHKLYVELERRFPSVGGVVGLAASAGRIGQPEAGLAHLDALPDEAVHRHQPYWAVRAHLLSTLGRLDEARGAYDRAMGLTEDPAIRRWLHAQLP